MKIMWMGNIILPAIAEKESLPPVYIVGWLVGLSRRLTQLPDVALTYVFDAPKALTGEVDGYRYYGLVNPTRPTQRCGEAYTRQLEDILRKEQPDVIHLWGTENQHTLAMVDAAEHLGMRERIVISIQGLLSIYAEHYRAYLPEHVCHGHTLKDLVKGNIVRQEAIYRRVGQYEQEALRMVHLEQYADRRPHQLSGGQQQRVAIARAVVNKPLVLLLDEPFSALDYKLRRAMQLEIKRLQRRLGITFVFVTHDQEEAFAMSDRVVVMNQGRIEQIGTPQEIYEEPSNLYVARFVGEINILPARIMSVPGEGIYIADISGRRFTLRTSRSFAAGDRVNVLLRPEDIRVYAHDDERPEGPYLTGRIEETVYKGATVDISIALDSGETLSVAEFFNEDDAEISYNRGERVAVTWVDGWEVVLPYEAD